MALHRKCAVVAQSGDSDAYYYANEQLHATICVISGNSFLLAEVARFQNGCRRIAVCSCMCLFTANGLPICLHLAAQFFRRSLEF